MLGGFAHGADLPALGGVHYSVPVKSIKEVRRASTMLQQYDFSCGSAALATLLTHHYDYPANERTIFEDMYARGDQQKIRKEGFSLLDMKNFLEARGFRADGFHQPLEKLAEAGIPAIVLISENGYNHFVVIKGLRGDRILLGDPASGTRVMPRERFDAAWRNKLLFVVHNRIEQARFNQGSDWSAAPLAPLAGSIGRDSLSNITLPKFGPGDF
ncbi:C39 family peptidase [Noviherbaspirillum sp. 1P10PC]|uniref:C39 family peptidase n=1 Tax=Noviherbaspirillum sp. 1P10PC TaxID=3132292 RepID=UPI0039A0A633